MNLADDKCPIARGLSCAGDSWSLLILRDAAQGMTRFDLFRKSLGIAPTILTKRLAALTEEGLLEKHRYSDHPPRDEYVLTAAGRDFLPIIVMIGAWGLRHRDSDKSVRLYDVETGQEVQPVVIDANTGQPIGSRHIHPAFPDSKK
jgi:DNA-binding HxlR family transcriptional regulator